MQIANRTGAQRDGGNRRGADDRHPTARPRKWRPSAATPRGAIAVAAVPWLAAAVGLFGCQAGLPDRVSHLHSDANQKLADAAAQEFDSYRAGDASLAVALAKNLAARDALSATVEAQAASLGDGDQATALTDQTWERMRTDLYNNLGLFAVDNLPQFPTPADRVAWAEAQLDARLERRLVQVRAIAKTLQALAEGQRRLAEQAAKDVARATAQVTQLAGQKPEQPPAEPSDATQRAETKALADAVQRLSKALANAAQETRANAAARNVGTALQQALLDAAAGSRDPGSASALAAAVGTGLDDESAALMEAYLESLDKQLTALDAKNPGAAPANPPAHALHFASVPALPVAAGATDLATLFKDARVFVRQAVATAQRDPAGAPSRRAATPPMSTADASKLLGPAYAASPPAGAGDATALATQIGNIASAVVGAVRTRRADVQQARASVGQLRASLQSAVTGAGASTGASGAGTTPDQSGAGWLTNVALAAEPRLAAQLAAHLDKNATTDQVKKQADDINKLVADIGTQAIAAKQRLAQYLLDLYSTEQDLREEDLRHAEALSAVLNFELKRWVWLGALRADYAQSFRTPKTRNPIPPDGQPSAVIFNTPADIDTWLAWYRAKLTVLAGATNGAAGSMWAGALKNLADYPSPSLRPAIVAPDDLVLASLRLLGENAREWQRTSAIQNDPLGFNTALANQRLYQAVRAANGTLLMVSLNRHLAGENGLRLDHELLEHDQQIDALVARASEAGIRLDLGDLKAFHDTGVTDADVQAVIQDFLLVWIAAKQ